MKILNFKFQISDLNGFTLVELIIYMGLMAFIFLLLTDILVAVFNVQLSTQSTSQVSQDGRYIYNRLIYDINHASTVSAPLNLGSSSAALSLTENGVDYSYSLNNGDLEITSQSTSSQLNSVDTQISGLNFTRIGNVNGKPTFRINFTVTDKIGGVSDSAVFQTTAGLR